MSDNKKHDVIVIGAGHNGLTAAAYLSKAGLNVGVVEGLSYIGGGCQTRENTLPGFKQEPYSVVHSFIQANPMILHDELGLKSKYGLKYIHCDESYCSMFPDGSYFQIYNDPQKTMESIARLCPKDADAYGRFLTLSYEVLDTVLPAFFAPPASMGQIFSMLEGTLKGQDTMRALLMSPQDIVNEWFTDERVRVSFMKLANESNMAPDIRGNGISLFLLVPIVHKFPYGTPQGGGIELCNALVRCLKANGGSLYVGNPVKKITTTGGRASGVVLSTGETLEAKKAVISAINIMKLIGDKMVDEMPAEVIDRVKRITPSTTSTLTSNYALNEPIKYKCGNIKSIMVELLPFMDDFLGHFEECKRGLLPRQPIPYLACHTLYDDTKAPAGKHCIQLYDPSPYCLRDGGPQKWDEVKEQQEDRKLAWLRQFATNMGDENILGRAVISPLDLERYSAGNFWQGEVQGIGCDLYQFLSMRPISAIGRYRTPIDGLYLTGMTCHPGGGIVGGGRATVQIVMEDLGIDFDDVVSA